MTTPTTTDFATAARRAKVAAIVRTLDGFARLNGIPVRGRGGRAARCAMTEFAEYHGERHERGKVTARFSVRTRTGFVKVVRIRWGVGQVEHYDVESLSTHGIRILQEEKR